MDPYDEFDREWDAVVDDILRSLHAAGVIRSASRPVRLSFGRLVFGFQRRIV